MTPSGEIDKPEGRASALGIRAVSKRFGSVQAVDAVSFDVQPGSIHALLGGNGSGKSTLIKILAGVHQADAGTIEIGGDQHDATSFSPAMAKDAHLYFVHQDPTTFPELTVAENLAMGGDFDVGFAGRVRWRTLNRRVNELLDRFDIPAHAKQPLAELGPATRTMIAVARGLQHQDLRSGAGVLVLDEPTASLPETEVDVLLEALQGYARAGSTIIYVTHRLEEVLKVADRATVFLNGRVSAQVERAEMSSDRLAELIVGKALAPIINSPHPVSEGGRVVLRTNNLRGGPITDVTFEVRSGEIVGIAGLLGSGRTSLLKMLSGGLRPAGGEVELDGKPVAFKTITDAIAAGVAYVPEHRGYAGFFDMTVTENVSVVRPRDFAPHGRTVRKLEREAIRDVIDTCGVKVASERSLLSSLSGGNQQKLLVGRWLRLNPKLLLLDEPTHGVDVGARADLYALLRATAKKGAGVIVVSCEGQELAAVCDRVLLLQDGRLATELSASDVSGDELDQLVYLGANSSDAN